MKDAKTELKPRIHDEGNGLDYVLAGDYYVPEITIRQEKRSIGKWGRMHRAYLRNENPALLNQLILSDRLFTYLADLNEQAEDRYNLMMKQMMETEGVTEALKRKDQMEWVRRVYSIKNRVEEIIKHELIYC